MTTFVVNPGGSLNGQLRVPGDKSISHRSVILGALAEGQTRVSGFLEGQDSLNTLAAFQSMGVPIEYIAGSEGEGGSLVIDGVGLHGLKSPENPLDVGNSGTAMRLMAGVLAAQKFPSTLIGDESLHGRPMGRVIDPLMQMGAEISSGADKRPPLAFAGGRTLNAIDYTTPVASAQIKSCLMLAALYANGETRIHEAGVSRDHTERMLRGFGVDVGVNDLSVSVHGGQKLSATSVDVPADISSAAFFIVGASIAPGSSLLLQHVGMNPTRTGILDILRLMGANIEITNERSVAGEPVADLRIQHSRLNGIDVPVDLVPLAIDEFPVLFVAAACAVGETRITGAAELRVKETDRIKAMADGLTKLGVNITELPDGAVIQGAQSLRGGVVDSFEDHRIAMAFSMAALVSDNSVTVTDCANVATSFPHYAELASGIGLGITTSDGSAVS